MRKDNSKENQKPGFVPTCQTIALKLDLPWRLSSDHISEIFQFSLLKPLLLMAWFCFVLKSRQPTSIFLPSPFLTLTTRPFPLRKQTFVRSSQSRPLWPDDPGPRLHLPLTNIYFAKTQGSLGDTKHRLLGGYKNYRTQSSITGLLAYKKEPRSLDKSTSQRSRVWFSHTAGSGRMSTMMQQWRKEEKWYQGESKNILCLHLKNRF